MWSLKHQIIEERLSNSHLIRIVFAWTNELSSRMVPSPNNFRTFGSRILNWDATLHPIFTPIIGLVNIDEIPGGNNAPRTSFRCDLVRNSGRGVLKFFQALVLSQSCVPACQILLILHCFDQLFRGDIQNDLNLVHLFSCKTTQQV